MSFNQRLTWSFCCAAIPSARYYARSAIPVIPIEVDVQHACAGGLIDELGARASLFCVGERDMRPPSLQRSIAGNVAARARAKTKLMLLETKGFATGSARDREGAWENPFPNHVSLQAFSHFAAF